MSELRETPAGIVKTDQQAELLVSSTPESDTTATSIEPSEPPAPTTEDALAALLDQHDESQQSDASSSDTSSADEPAKKEGFEQFAQQFKDYVGIDLQEAITSYQQMTIMLQQQQEKQQQLEFQSTMRNLQNDWGVNEAELNRRLAAVAQYADTLPPELRSQFDNPQGITLLWRQIEKRSSVPSTSAGEAQRGGNSSKPPTFRKSELMEMMMKNPALYSAKQAEIARAFEVGTIIDDI